MLAKGGNLEIMDRITPKKKRDHGQNSRNSKPSAAVTS
jgi:hypothetical protein